MGYFDIDAIADAIAERIAPKTAKRDGQDVFRYVEADDYPKVIAAAIRETLATSNTCLARVYPDEPIFVLRAQDVTAPAIVEEWLSRARFSGKCAPEKLQDTRDTIAGMQRYPHRKIPD